MMTDYLASLYLGSETPLRIANPSPEETQRIEDMLKRKRTFTVQAHIAGAERTITINGAAVPWWSIDAGDYFTGIM